jgi:hypothetical protein
VARQTKFLIQTCINDIIHAVSSEIARRIGDLTRLDVDFEETLHGAGFFDKLVLDLSRGSGIDRC